MVKLGLLDWLVLGGCINQFKTGNLHAAVAAAPAPAMMRRGLARSFPGDSPEPARAGMMAGQLFFGDARWIH